MTELDPYKIQKELSEFIKKKYGSDAVPFVDVDDSDKQEPYYRDEDYPDIDFDITPKELSAYLDKYVINQKEAIDILSTKVCTHFHRIKYLKTHPHASRKLIGNVKNNILMIGPTGVGKTFIIKLIADKLGVPFVKADATKFSETGYVGKDVEDIIRDLVKEADGNIKLAEIGIVYIDEIDKIASSRNLAGPDVSRTGVQRNLLKLMEETEVNLKVPHDIASQMEALMEIQRSGKLKKEKINTKNILFIVSGAFDGLADIIKRKKSKQGIGFTGSLTSEKEKVEYIKLVENDDLIEYGFESEFIGRLPVKTVLNYLTEDDLFQILKNPESSIINSKKLDFASYGINIKFTDDALRYYAKLAAKEKTGARALVSVIEKSLINYEKELPSYDIKDFYVTLEIAQNSNVEIKKVKFLSALYKFIDEYQNTYNITMEFTDDAREYLYEKSDEIEDVLEYLHNIFKGYEYGLNLLKLNKFTITGEVISKPQEYLTSLIKKSYEK